MNIYFDKWLYNENGTLLLLSCSPPRVVRARFGVGWGDGWQQQAARQTLLRRAAGEGFLGKGRGQMERNILEEVLFI